MDDLVGGRRWNMDAPSEIGNQQQFRYLVVSFFKRHNKSGNANCVCRSLHLQPGRCSMIRAISAKLPARADRRLSACKIDAFEGGHGIPVFGYQVIPGNFLVFRFLFGVLR